MGYVNPYYLTVSILSGMFWSLPTNILSLNNAQVKFRGWNNAESILSQ